MTPRGYIPLVSRIDWTSLMAGLMAYQLGAIRFGWPRVSRLWPWNAVLFSGLIRTRSPLAATSDRSGQSGQIDTTGWSKRKW